MYSVKQNQLVVYAIEIQALKCYDVIRVIGVLVLFFERCNYICQSHVKSQIFVITVINKAKTEWREKWIQAENNNCRASN